MVCFFFVFGDFLCLHFAPHVSFHLARDLTGPPSVSAVASLSRPGSKCDDRVIRVDWDEGFSEGRQFGRGDTGGQRRDDYRPDYDQGRGGFNPRQAAAQAAAAASPHGGSAEAAARSRSPRSRGRSERSQSGGVGSRYCDQRYHCVKVRGDIFVCVVSLVKA
jgi:hypothetical protein